MSNVTSREKALSVNNDQCFLLTGITKSAYLSAPHVICMWGARGGEKMSALYELEVLFTAPTGRRYGPCPSILTLEHIDPLA